MQEPFMTCALVYCTATVSLKSGTRRKYALRINGVSAGIEFFITYRQQGGDDLQSAGKKKIQANARSWELLEIKWSEIVERVDRNG
jgi:hypothetical protein